MQKLTEISTKLHELSVKVDMLETSQKNLRGHFNRKLKSMKEEDEDEEEKPGFVKSKTLNSFNPFG